MRADSKLDSYFVALDLVIDGELLLDEPSQHQKLVGEIMQLVHEHHGERRQDFKIRVEVRSK